MKQQSSPATDHRIFGYDSRGFVRVNLYNGAGHPEAGSLYTWLVFSSEREMARKLTDQWEQPALSEEEFDTLEQLECSETVDVPCGDCGGSGIDPGGISAYEPEDCRTCHGTRHEAVPALVGFGAPAPAPRIASIGNGLYVRTRKAVA
jgi:hypothetical protein